ncbi:MAG: lysylphosphatidylglycerol synthase transmembrane domain-containing protein [Pseudomonadota bacterium]
MKKITSCIKKLAPWAVAVLIFVYLFHKHPLHEIINSAATMNVPFFFSLAILYFILMFLLDTYSIARILRLFGHRETMREMLPARGVTYLLMVVNYAAAQAAFAFYQYRRHGLPISKMLGIFGIIVIADLYMLVTLAFVTSFFTTWPFEVGGMNIANFVRIFAAAAYAAFALFLVLKRWQARIGWLGRFRQNKFFILITTARLSDYLAVGLARLPIHVFIMVGMYAALFTFNARVPFLKVLANIPLAYFIGALPITPGGLGTSNAALVALFEPFVTSPAIASGAISAGDLIFSFSLVWMFTNYAMKALTGLICLKLVSKDLFKPTPEVPEEVAESQAPHVLGNL